MLKLWWKYIRQQLFTPIPVIIYTQDQIVGNMEGPSLLETLENLTKPWKRSSSTSASEKLLHIQSELAPLMNGLASIPTVQAGTALCMAAIS